MSRFLDFLAVLLGTLVGAAGVLLLLGGTSVQQYFIGVGCFLLIIAWRLGTIREEVMATNRLLCELVEAQPERTTS